MEQVNKVDFELTTVSAARFGVNDVERTADFKLVGLDSKANLIEFNVLERD